MKKQLFLLTTSALLLAGILPTDTLPAAEVQAENPGATEQLLKAVSGYKYGYYKPEAVEIQWNNIKKAIKNGADVNAMYHEEPLLFVAIRGQHPELVELLVKSGALTTARGHHDTSCLHALSTNNTGRFLRGLSDDEIIATTKIMKILVDHGADVNAQNEYGVTPLELAVGAFPENEELLTTFIREGADPFIKKTNGHTIFQDISDPGTRQLVENALRERENQAGPIIEKFLPRDLTNLALDYEFSAPGEAQPKAEQVEVEDADEKEGNEKP